MTLTTARQPKLTSRHHKGIAMTDVAGMNLPVIATKKPYSRAQAGRSIPGFPGLRVDASGWIYRKRRMNREKHHMSKQTYTPGDTVTAGNIAAGDMIFARRDHLTKEPSAPVRVEKTSSFPKAPDLVRFVVQSPYQVRSPWVIGPIRADKTFTRAVPEAPEG